MSAINRTSAQRFQRARRKARALALQALFEHDTAGHRADRVVLRLLRESSLPAEHIAFTRDLVNGVLLWRASIDAIIQRFAPAFPVSLLSAIDRNILRLAIYEILYDRQTPPSAVINEAVELAKRFGSDSSPRFVNGVLGALMRHIHEYQSGEKKGG